MIKEIHLSFHPSSYWLKNGHIRFNERRFCSVKPIAFCLSHIFTPAGFCFFFSPSSGKWPNRLTAHVSLMRLNIRLDHHFLWNCLKAGCIVSVKVTASCLQVGQAADPGAEGKPVTESAKVGFLHPHACRSSDTQDVCFHDRTAEEARGEVFSRFPGCFPVAAPVNISVLHAFLFGFFCLHLRLWY